MPLSKDDMEAEQYVAGVSCPNCFEKTTEQQRARFAERARQIDLARKRGIQHIGVRPKIGAKKAALLERLITLTQGSNRL